MHKTKREYLPSFDQRIIRPVRRNKLVEYCLGDDCLSQQIPPQLLKTFRIDNFLIRDVPGISHTIALGTQVSLQSAASFNIRHLDDGWNI